MIIFLGALAIFMAGSTKDVVTGVNSLHMGYDDAWKTDLSLPVPIILGNRPDLSRGALNSQSDMHGERFGIFAMDRDSASVQLLMSNEVAHYVYNEGGMGHFRFGGWNTEEVVKYYPRNSNKNYSFYAYYKRGEETVEINDTKVLMNVKLFRPNDVLWGKAEAPEGEMGFNEAYFRKNPDASVSFDFSHPASQLSFSVSPSENLALPEKSIFRIEQMWFYDVPADVKLCVADCNKESSVVGKFTEVSAVRDSVFLECAEGGSPNLATDLRYNSLPDTHVHIGQDIFIAPQTETVKCVLVVTNVGNGVYRIPFDLHPSIVNPEMVGYEAGKRYAYNIVIGRKGPRPVIEKIVASRASY